MQVMGTSLDKNEILALGAVILVAAYLLPSLVRNTVNETASLISDGYDALPVELKPSSPDNLINRTIDGVTGAIVGDSNATLGGELWDLGNEYVYNPITGQEELKQNWFGILMDDITGVKR